MLQLPQTNKIVQLLQTRVMLINYRVVHKDSVADKKDYVADQLESYNDAKVNTKGKEAFGASLLRRSKPGDTFSVEGTDSTTPEA